MIDLEHYRSDNNQKEKRYLTVDCWICSKKTIEEVEVKISDEINLLMVLNLFACIISPNFYSRNISLLYTEVSFYKLVLHFWIFKFQAFHVCNIKSRSKRTDITVSDSGHSWSVYLAHTLWFLPIFYQWLYRVTSHFLCNWQKMLLSFSYAVSAKRDNRLFSRKVDFLFGPDFWSFMFVNPSLQIDHWNSEVFLAFDKIWALA